MLTMLTLAINLHIRCLNYAKNILHDFHIKLHETLFIVLHKFLLQ